MSARRGSRSLVATVLGLAVAGLGACRTPTRSTMTAPGGEGPATADRPAPTMATPADPTTDGGTATAATPTAAPRAASSDDEDPCAWTDPCGEPCGQP